MKIERFFFLLLFLNELSAQVYVEHRLPSQIPTGEEVRAAFTIRKPVTRDFAQYEISFQPGLVISGAEVAGATFRSENNKVKLVWSIGPQTETIGLVLGFVAGTARTFTLEHKFEYQQEGERKTALLQPLIVEAGAGIEVKPVDEPVRLSQVVPGQLPEARIDSLQARLSDPAQARIHVAQLRRDAREARKVGENELRAANLEISEAKKDLEKSQAKTSSGSAVKNAEARLQKAEMNRQIAEKILALAKSLEANADDIERAIAADSTRSAHTGGVVTAAGSSEPTLPSSSVAASDTLYHIQVGAFAQKPDRTPYGGLGRVMIVNEDGLHKVLIGGFSSREEARSLQQRLAAQGVEGFLVRYRGKARLR